ncbi:hypothetical protein ABFS82_04G129900 [Erythranthe guttata]
MAAYGALVSLTHTIDQVLQPPPAHHFIIDRERIESLRERVVLLLDFLANQSFRRSKEVEDLEMRITDASNAAEDIIESNARNQIRAKYEFFRKMRSTLKNMVHINVKRDIPMIVEEFVFIEKELRNIKDDKVTEDEQSEKSPTVSSPRPLSGGKNTMVGFDEHLIQIMSMLATDESDRRIIPIVGMGGIGKTTLATNVYNNPFIVEKFEVRAWFVVSQECTGKEILLGLLRQVVTTGRNELEMNDDDELGEKLHKTLFGRRYLIVMDDIWDIKAWEMVNRFLPDNDNGSRILVTTRLMKLASDVGSCTPYQLNLLEKSQSWDLLREKIFAEGRCPVELEVIGRKIAKKCRGLPLALVVVGGLLAKSERDHWKYVEEDLTSSVNNQDDEFCMKILLLSYIHLPIYLKPCFLYFAVFPQDIDIKVSWLVRLWIAEGFIRQCKHKSLEEIGEEYLEDLIDRNLILVGKRKISGEVKTYHIHDLLSDLCKSEARKHNFLVFAKLDKTKASSDMLSVRRLIINGGRWKKIKLRASGSAATTRSFISFFYGNSSSYSARRFILLRVLDVVDRYPQHEILKLINSRYVACMGSLSMSSSISRLWSLQTLVVDEELTLPIEIWQMPQLRHVKAKTISLPDPPSDNAQKITVLENLQTLSTVGEFKCSEEVIKRIPNVKKLGIVCSTVGSHCLSNLGFLHKLESLSLAFDGTIGRGNMVFPSSVKKLCLSECKIPWEDMSIVGSLPNLQVLKLRSNAAVGQKWISNEEEFVRLKFLLIELRELEIWEADSTHFPCLEELHLRTLNLKEIPSDFSEILPLQVIDLNLCSSSLLTSAKEMSEERENLGYDALQIRYSSLGVLTILVKRGINLSVRDGRIRDPYVVIKMGEKRLKTRAVIRNVNPDWDKDFTIVVSDPCQPISLTVYDQYKFNLDDKMGDADFDIRPLVEVAKMNPNGLPNDNRVMQDMRLRLKNIDCGEVELQLEWSDCFSYYKRS